MYTIVSKIKTYAHNKNKKIINAQDFLEKKNNMFGTVKENCFIF